MAGHIAAEQGVLLDGNRRVHHRQRGEMEPQVRQGREDLAEVGLVQTVTRLVQRHALDIDRGAVVGVDAPLEGVVVVGLVEVRIQLPIMSATSSVPSGRPR